ncbi:hypothetical protein NL676_020840 [Syzygium grande]|nr:hypothetical protein NL676_020840 [Syzygium grande]
MPIKSLIHDMRSRSSRAVHDGSAAAVAAAAAAEAADGLSRSCWVNMPQELLREVLAKIEASEGSWPSRKSVVACAGVCRSWRHLVKEIVKVPEVSGILTFPISVKQPGPRESLLQCFIKRNRSNQTYHLYIGLTNALSDDGKFLLAARKCRRPTCTDYVISLHADDVSKGSCTYVGKLRSNFLGTKFTISDGQPPHAGARMPKSSRGPRRMHCIMDAIPASAIEPGGVAPTQTELPLSSVEFFPSLPFFRTKSNRVESGCSGPMSRTSNWLLLLKMNLLGPNMRRSSSSLGRWGRIYLRWIIGIPSQHSRLSQSVSAALTQRLRVSELLNRGFLVYREVKLV